MGAEAIIITMAGEPAGKGRPRFARATGRAYTPAKTRDYEAGLRYAAERVMAGKPPLTGPVVVDVVAGMPVPQSWSRKKQAQALAGIIRPTTRPDWENIGKMLDALNEIVWRDDAQVVDGRVRKVYREAPSLSIKVTPLEIGVLAA